MRDDGALFPPGPPARAGTDSEETTITNHTTIDITHTVSADAKYLVVRIGWGASTTRTVTGVNWDQAGTPQAMQERRDASSAPGTTSGVSIYILALPTVKTGVIRITFSGTCYASYARATNLRDVALAGGEIAGAIDAEAHSVSNSNRTTAATAALVMPEAAAVLAVAAWASIATSFTPDAGLTEIKDVQAINGGDGTVTVFMGDRFQTERGSFTPGVTAAHSAAGSLAAIAVRGNS